MRHFSLMQAFINQENMNVNTFYFCDICFSVPNILTYQNGMLHKTVINNYKKNINNDSNHFFIFPVVLLQHVS